MWDRVKRKGWHGRKMNYLLAILLVCIFLSSLNNVSANPVIPQWNPGSPVTDDKNWIPYMNDPNVLDLSFKEEWVIINASDINSMVAWLNASYIIQNTGSNWINQTIAFPGYSDFYFLHGQVSIQVDGTEVAWGTTSIGIPNNDAINPYGFDDHYCFFINVTFAPLQHHNISTKYPVAMMNYRDSKTIEGTLNLIYIVTTGSLWPEPIENATIIISLPQDCVKEFALFSPDVPQYNNNSLTTNLTWHYSNWQPQKEIVASWFPKNWPVIVTANQTAFNLSKGEEIFIELKINYTGSVDWGIFHIGHRLKIDFGDGTIQNWTDNTTFQHRYNESGNYEVKVWVMEAFETHIISEEQVVITVNVDSGQESGQLSNYYIYVGIIIVVIIILSSVVIFLKLRNKPPQI